MIFAVTSYVDVWIEIHVLKSIGLTDDVTSYVDVWIEIYKNIQDKQGYESHLM